MTEEGTRQIRTGLKRTSNGLLVSVIAQPEIEALVQGWGDGEPGDVKAYGRFWLPAEEGDLLVYPLDKSPGPLALEKGNFVIDRPGRPLIEGETVNLSFLRLVGISKGGVRFLIKGVYDTDGLVDLVNRINIAKRRFYLAYMRPVSLTVTLTTTKQEG